MKLINKTYSYLFKWLLIIGVIGSLFCFVMIDYINHEETDEFLTYEMHRLIRHHEKFNELPEFNKVANIIQGDQNIEPTFNDTLLLESGDNEMVPYRQLYFSLKHNDNYVTIVLRHLLLGKDDILEATLLIVGGLMLLIFIVFVLIVKHVGGELWKPFYTTLTSLKNFNLTEPIPVFQKTDVDEFRSLNSTAELLFKKITSDFRQNKEFNENASHELQTHLSVIRINAENLINKLSDQQPLPHEINDIYEASLKLSRIQKSLLLLSKISNDEYANKTNTDVKGIVENTLSAFSESIELLGLSMDMNLENCTVYIDAGLMEILVNNLVKNAVVHNKEYGYVKITLTTEYFSVENSGSSVESPEKYFGRFAKGRDGHTGIGLSIVKEICTKHNFSIDYTSDNGKHLIKIFFPS